MKKASCLVPRISFGTRTWAPTLDSLHHPPDLSQQKHVILQFGPLHKYEKNNFKIKYYTEKLHLYFSSNWTQFFHFLNLTAFSITLHPNPSVRGHLHLLDPDFRLPFHFTFFSAVFRWSKEFPKQQISRQKQQLS